MNIQEYIGAAALDYGMREGVEHAVFNSCAEYLSRQCSKESRRKSFARIVRFLGGIVPIDLYLGGKPVVARLSHCDEDEYRLSFDNSADAGRILDGEPLMIKITLIRPNRQVHHEVELSPTGPLDETTIRLKLGSVERKL